MAGELSHEPHIESMSVLQNLWNEPYIARRPGKTNYVAITGPGTAWSEVGKNAEDRDSSKWRGTLWLIELNGSDIDWSEPRDLSVDEAIAYLQGQETSPWKRPSVVYGLRGSGSRGVDRICIPATAATELLKSLILTDESKVIPYTGDGEIDWSGRTDRNGP
jgi:hypothetical protein